MMLDVVTNTYANYRDDHLFTIFVNVIQYLYQIWIANNSRQPTALLGTLLLIWLSMDK